MNENYTHLWTEQAYEFHELLEIVIVNWETGVLSQIQINVVRT